jgi:hypothetical protein
LKLTRPKFGALVPLDPVFCKELPVIKSGITFSNKQNHLEIKKISMPFMLDLTTV